ncbi:MAG: hypothetical protein ACLTER_16740 [Ruminococcus sp.]
MLEAAEEALKQQGYYHRKTEVIHDIPCTFFSYEDAYGIVFMDQGDSVMDVLYFLARLWKTMMECSLFCIPMRWVGWRGRWPKLLC